MVVALKQDVHVKDFHSVIKSLSSPGVERSGQVVEAVEPVEVRRGAGAHVCS